jgi:PST family polysaccharide transporter
MIISKFVNKEYQKLISNIFFSGIFQIVTFLSPLITTPYLVKIIGIEKFGFVSFVTVFFTYLYSITDYGFNITANREIALNRNSKDILSKIFADVMFAKVLLILVALILLLICVLIIPKFKSNCITFLLSFTLIIGRVLIPNWFFQGLEQMRRLSILNFFSQALFILLIFLVVKEPNDYKYVVFLQGISYIFIGIISLFIIFSRILVGVTLVFQLKGAVNQIKSTFTVFISSISIVSYNNANLLILGFFANDRIVGYYGVVDKVINVIRQGIGATSTAIFPYICRLSQLSHEAVYDFFKKFFIHIIFGIILLSIVIIFFAKEIVYFVVSASDFQLQNTLVLMSFVPIVVILSNPPCFILLAYNKSKIVSQIMVVGCLLNVTLNLILVPLLDIKGTIISVYITEFFITITLSYFLIKIYPQFSFFKNRKIN